MKYAFLLSLIVLAGCGGKSNGGGGNHNQKSKSESPVTVDAKDVVNSTDAEIQIDAIAKTIKVFPPAKDKITIEPYIGGSPNANLGFCAELKFDVQFRKDLPKYEAEQARTEKTLEFYNLQKDDLERALKEPGHSDSDLRSFRNQLVSVNNRITATEALIASYKRKIILVTTQINKTKYREMVGGIGTVKWTNTWDHNVQLITDDNKGWNVEKAGLPFKAKMKAIGLEVLPAEYMITDMSQIGLRVKDGAAILEGYYRGYSEVVNLSLYAACPLLSNADIGVKKPDHSRIEIEVTFEK